MKRLLIIASVILTIVNLHAQADTTHYSFQVPKIEFGDNLQFDVLSFEALDSGKFSILYYHELRATIRNPKEFTIQSRLGAYTDDKGKEFIANSDRVLILIRQVFDKNGAQTTDDWPIAIRELTSDDQYTLEFPENFKHPIIEDKFDVVNSLKNVAAIEGLSPLEYEALLLMAKDKYNFYEYPKPSNSAILSPVRSIIAGIGQLKNELEEVKSGMQELSATFGKGNIPKDEKLLFKRKVKDKMRMAGSVIEKENDSCEVKLYIALDDNADYQLLGSKTFFGDVKPSFSTDIVVDKNLNPIASYGYVINKTKDDKGEKITENWAIGIDPSGEANFWKLEVGKNKLSSFQNPTSFIMGEDLVVVSVNGEKVFKSYLQVTQFKKGGESVRIYPKDESEINSEKTSFFKLPQPSDKDFKSGFLSNTTKKIIHFTSIGEFDYVFFAEEGVSGQNTQAATKRYGNIHVWKFDKSHKILATNDIRENNSANPVDIQLISGNKDSEFYLLGYDYDLLLKITNNHLSVESIETEVHKIVPMYNKNLISENNYASSILMRTAIGNGFQLAVFPKNEKK